MPCSFREISKALYIFFPVFTSALYGQVLIDSVAGGGSLEGKVGSSAPLEACTAGAVSPDGSIYFSGRWRVYRMGKDGVIHVIAGTGDSGFAGDGGPALSARLLGPAALTVDESGNVYFVDRYRIRRVASDGTITTIAGNGYPPTDLTDGPALTTPLGPYKIAADSRGNVYFSELLQHRLRKVSSDGMVSLVAGTPSDYPADYSDGIPAIQAAVSPTYIGADRAGNITLSEGTRIRQITPDGIIHTILPIQFVISSMVESSSGAIYFFGLDSTGKPGSWTFANGTVQQSSTQTGTIFGVDDTGTRYFQNGSRIYSATASGNANLLAGSGTSTAADGAPAKGALLTFSGNTRLAIDNADRVLFAETATCRIRGVGADGSLVTLAGTGTCATTATGGPALSTNLCVPAAIAASRSGSIFAACTDTTLLRVDAAGSTHIVPTPPRTNPNDVTNVCSQAAADSKDTFFCRLFGTQVLRIAADGTASKLSVPVGISTINAIYVGMDDTLYALFRPTVDVPERLYSWNGASWVTGPNIAYPFNSISALAIDKAGAVYAVDGIRLTRTSGNEVSDIGLTTGGSLADSISAQSASVAGPGGVAIDSSGKIYFIDYYSQRIRRLTGSPASLPVISLNGVVNAASYAAGPIAAGELIAIFGKNLAYAPAVQTLTDIQFDTAIAATRVRFSNGTYAPVLAVSAGQVNAIVPQNVVSGKIDLAVEVDGVRSPSVTLPVASAAPGIFTADGSGSGAGSILNQDGTVNSASNRAMADGIIAVYGTGIGALTPAVYEGFLDVASPFGLAVAQVTATIGGAAATVVYAGGAPFLVAGVNQINLRIPHSTPQGAAPIVLTVGNVSSNQASVWVR